jgi:hypothetical protein
MTGQSAVVMAAPPHRTVVIAVSMAGQLRSSRLVQTGRQQRRQKAMAEMNKNATAKSGRLPTAIEPASVIGN